MPQFGTIKRAKPRVRVLRGFNPNEPHSLTQTAPVSSLNANGDANTAGIKSGQVMTLGYVSANSRYEWQLGWVAGRVPYIAYNDSTDEDVIEAGNMPGLSSAGQFEIATPYFKSADENSLDNNVLITPDGVSGNVKVAGAEELVMGIVTRSPSTADGSVVPSYPNSGVALADRKMVTFVTNFQRVDAAV